MLSTILLVFAFVLATLAALWVSLPDPGRGRLIAASLAFFYAAILFGKEALGKYLPVVVASALLFGAGCAQLSDPKSPESILLQQVASLGFSQLTGGAVTPADVDGAAALVRSLAGKKTKVTSTDIKVAAVSGTNPKSNAAPLGTQLADAVSTAIAKGVPQDKAIELAASKLNETAATTRVP